MRYIKKLPEPKELSAAKCGGLTLYDDMTKEVRDAVKIQLLKEQGYICAYCMRRIRHYPDFSTQEMQIEHYIAQSSETGKKEPSLSVEYRNMLGVCPGGKYSGVHDIKNRTCDQHRGDRDLTVNPLDNRLIDQVQYKSDGTIYSENSNIDHDLNEILNLNCTAAKLPVNRKAALCQFQSAIAKDYQGKTLTKKDWASLLERVTAGNTDGELMPFAGIVVNYIEKRLRRG